MTSKVYAVFSIPKSPEYNLIALFKTKEKAKEYVKEIEELNKNMGIAKEKRHEYDIQIENVMD